MLEQSHPLTPPTLPKSRLLRAPMGPSRITEASSFVQEEIVGICDTCESAEAQGTHWLLVSFTTPREISVPLTRSGYYSYRTPPVFTEVPLMAAGAAAILRHLRRLVPPP